MTLVDEVIELKGKLKAAVEEQAKVAGIAEEKKATLEAAYSELTAVKGQLENQKQELAQVKDAAAKAAKESADLVAARDAEIVKLKSDLALVPVADAKAGTEPVKDGGQAQVVDHRKVMESLPRVEAMKYYKEHKKEIDASYT